MIISLFYLLHILYGQVIEFAQAGLLLLELKSIILIHNHFIYFAWPNSFLLLEMLQRDSLNSL